MVHDIDFYRVAFLCPVSFFEGSIAAVEPGWPAKIENLKILRLGQRIF